MVMSDVINLFHEGRIEQSGDPVSVYTKPVSSFAASFIGNYNQITSEQFQTMTGTAKSGEVAISLRRSASHRLRLSMTRSIILKALLRIICPGAMFCGIRLM